MRITAISILFLLITSHAFADETLLVCDGESVEWWDEGVHRTGGLDDELTLAINGNNVETDSILVHFSNRDGTTWVWTFDVGEQTWLFNLNTISGRLTKYVSPKGKTSPLIRIVEWRCSRVEQRLIE